MIIIGADGQPSYMNEEAKRALNGRPICTILDPGLSAERALFRSETGVYRVRSIPSGHGGQGKIILLEPLPGRDDLKRRLSPYGLTPREEEIAILTIQGLSNREIAERLFITEQTVKDHLQNIFEKIRVKRRSELTAKVLGLSEEPYLL